MERKTTSEYYQEYLVDLWKLFWLPWSRIWCISWVHMEFVFLTVFTYGCLSWVSRQLLKRSCNKIFLRLLHFISVSVISWCFIIRYKRSIRQLLVWKYQFCHKIFKCFHWGFKRNVLTTFIRAVILLMFLFLVIFQKTLSSQDLTFHRVSFRNNISILFYHIF